MNRYKVRFLNGKPFVHDTRTHRIVKEFENYPAGYTGMRTNSSSTPGLIEAREFCEKLNEAEIKMNLERIKKQMRIFEDYEKSRKEKS